MVAPFTNTSSTSNEPTVAKPEPVIVVTPDNAPLVSVAVPSVKLPPVIAPEPVIVVAPVTAPPSTFTAPSNTIAEPVAGVILIAPVLVLIVTAASPAVISSDLIELADTPVIPEPSPVNVVAATVPATVTVPSDKVTRSVSSV